MKISHCRVPICTLTLAAAALSQAGTFTLVSLDTSLLAGSTLSSGTASWSKPTPIQLQYVLQGTATSWFRPNTGQTVAGQIEWHVQWVPAYVGEPVPDHYLVEIEGYGHAYLSSTNPAPPNFDSSASGSASILDTFYNDLITASHGGGFSKGTLTDHSYGTIFGGTGSFTYNSTLGVYESTILYEVNSAAFQSAGSTMASVANSSDLKMKLTVKKIGSQIM